MFRILLLTLILFQVSYSQDSTIISPDSTIEQVVYEEQILETIRIEAVVEKPSVTLIPKKAETDVGDVPFSIKSFDKELQAKPEIIMEYGKELEGGKRIEKLKKILEKKDN